jgi:hypothetical protein
VRHAAFRSAQTRIGGGANATPVGSRLALAFARESGMNFISPAVLDAVRNRLAAPERHETLKADRLWADLLSSMPLCFNLFGGVAGDPGAARRAVDAWWPEAPAGDAVVRFEHSPGRRDPAFLGNQSAFDAAFAIHGRDGSRGIVGVETKYHEHALAERPPKPVSLARYVEVTERFGIFVEGWRERILGKDLQQIWLDHLLVLALIPNLRGAVIGNPVRNQRCLSAVTYEVDVERATGCRSRRLGRTASASTWRR